MAPRKPEDKAVEQIQRDDERLIAMEGKLSTLEERMEAKMTEMMKLLTMGFEKLDLRKDDQIGGGSPARCRAGYLRCDLQPRRADQAKGVSRRRIWKGSHGGTAKLVRSKVCGRLWTIIRICHDTTTAVGSVGGQRRIDGSSDGDSVVRRRKRGPLGASRRAIL